MKHEWASVPNTAATFGRVARRCRLCGAEQERHPKTWWMRTVGYAWRPLVGRCKGKGARK